jgi:hypothetical protein
VSSNFDLSFGIFGQRVVNSKRLLYEAHNECALRKFLSAFERHLLLMNVPLGKVKRWYDAYFSS